MNIKLHLVVGALALAAVSMGASFTESFDTGPTGWTDTTNTTFGNSSGGDDVAFGSGTWHALNNSTPVGSTGWFSNPLGPFTTHSGAGMLNANYNSTGGTNNIDTYMMTPVLNLSNGDTFSFWARTVDTPEFPDRLLLKLSTNGSSTSAASFTNTLLTINAGLTTSGFPNTWTQFSVTLSGLSAGATGRFAFNYNVTNGGPTSTFSDFIGIDDVNYTANPVPEPATMTALGLGIAAMVRRRRKSA